MQIELADITYPLLALATWGYARVLEYRRRDRRRTYAPRFTWVTVVIGVSIVLTFALVRVLLGTPTLPPSLAVLYGWAVVAVHFVFGGTPIIWWQISANHKDDMEALAEARRLMGEE